MVTKLGRRQFLAYGSAALGSSLLLKGCTTSGSSASGGGKGDPIVVGSLLDATGAIALYGQAMIDGTTMAIDEINAAGGVLGRPLELKQYDTQSDIQKYTQFAQQLILQDKVAVLMGGITSASREAVRPVIDKYQTLYFYNVRYEGGVCDKYTFINGVTPSGQQSVLIPWAVGQYGPRIYTIAADYNYGQIAAKWAKVYASQSNGEVVREDFIPLDVSDFSTIISKIQDESPDMILSLLVGSNHEGFYRQYQAANGSIPIVSPTFQHAYVKDKVARPEYEGIVVAHSYLQEYSSPENQKFIDGWHAKFGEDKIVNDLGMNTYVAWKMWAAAAEQAGSVDREEVTRVLESGFTYESPIGPIQYDKTHHVNSTVWLAEATSEQTYNIIGEPKRDIAAVDDQGKCDLMTKPDTFEQFVPEI
ncbi:MAG: urea ABC transporter substrate-binding protein [Elainellaceae cyanobacterium]